MPNSISLPAREIYRKIKNNIQSVIRGQDDTIRKLLAAFATSGHVLLEDYPGTGKTTLAKALACSIDSIFTRIQFTPDLLPSDIIGVSIFNQQDHDFHFHKGPIFTNILLADEINRASPRTQSALLEAMAEAQVSTDGRLYPLEDLFFVVATQNPVETSGTYPLPEAQLDRFALKFSLGYVPPDDEVAILSDQHESHPIESIKACASLQDIISLMESVKKIRISSELKRYIIDIVGATRASADVVLGASPRASLCLMKVAQAIALFDGNEFVIPENIKEMAVSAISHRLVMDPQAKFSGQTTETIVEEILNKILVPV